MSRWNVRAAVVGLVLALGSTAPASGQQAWVPEALPAEEGAPPIDFESRSPTRIVAIAGGVSDLKRGRLSGLFVADHRGTIFYHSSAGAAPHDDTVEKFQPIDRFFEPTGLAFAEPVLYVFDNRTRTLWSIDLGGDVTERRARSFDRRPAPPRHMAVSPHGLLAVIEEGRVVFLDEDAPATRYERSRFRQPIGLAFSSWDTLQVLDGVRGLVTITFRRLKGRELEFVAEGEEESKGPGDGWRAMAVHSGVVYLAAEDRVFAYLESDKALIPALPTRAGYDRISQIALTREDLYLLDEWGQLRRVPRPQPVDLALEGDAASSQDALLAFYWYLAEREMLPVREALARRRFASIEDFLAEEGVLLAPAALAGEEAGIRVYGKGPPRAGARQPGAASARPSAGTPTWNELICWFNRELCARSASGPAGIEQGQRLTVPDLKIARRLGRERIVLEGQPLSWYLERLVFAPELRERAGEELVERLNPELAKGGHLLQLDRGLVAVPVERWTVTAAVPAADFQERSSGLWALEERFEGVSLISRSAYVEQAARSLPLPAPAYEPGDDHDGETPCERLRAEKARWFEAIHYPNSATGEALDSALPSKEVRVGVLEHATTVFKTHQVFCLDSDHPTWYAAQDLELVAQPDAATFALGDLALDDLATFSPEAHHGTHVAALIAGRADECWSGLLPRARLVLIDLNDAVHRQIVKAEEAQTRVFNVSQEFAGPQEELKRLIRRYERRALFVAAAGNSGSDLDQAAALPAPACWGAIPNVITVTASDWDGVILPEIETSEGFRPGANFGRRYVDLVAPGEAVVSASALHRFGPATGTSQAAPQVAAAAALLVDWFGARFEPGDAKARLIATAEWNPAYFGKVWGGRLDFGDAVLFPRRNLLRTTTGAQLGQLHSFEAANDPQIVVANTPSYYERHGDGRIAPEKIQFSRILSLQRRPDGKYRVVFREAVTEHLKILLDAVLEDAKKPPRSIRLKIECSSFERFEEAEREFRPDPGCDDGLSITQIEEYIQGGPYHIQWEEHL